MENRESTTSSAEARCHACGRSPATHVHFIAAVGRLLVMFEESYDDFVCKECGLEIYDRVMKRHLLNTWWSPKAILFGSTIGTARNLYERSKLLNLPDPQRFQVAVTRTTPPQPRDFPKLEPPPSLPPPKPSPPSPARKPSDTPTYLAVALLWAVSLVVAYFTAVYVSNGRARQTVQLEGSDGQGNAFVEQSRAMKAPSASALQAKDDLADDLMSDSKPPGEKSPTTERPSTYAPKPAEEPKLAAVSSTVGKVTRIATDTRGNRLCQVRFEHPVNGWEGKRLSVWRRDEAGKRLMLGTVIVVKARDYDLVAATVVYTSGKSLVEDALADYDFVREGDEVEPAAAILPDGKVSHR